MSRTIVNREWLMARCVCQPNGCWVWTRARDRGGYGHFGLMRNGKRTVISAHRASYKTLVGDIPDGLMVLHRCDNRPCINPDHLFLGTARDNMRDAQAKGRLRGLFGYGDGHRGSYAKPTVGESHPNAKLREPQVLAILEMKGKKSQRAIATLFGVSRTLVRGIHARKRWRSLGSGG